jgi:deferrochelatase/peroxidase EfeB
MPIHPVVRETPAPPPLHRRTDDPAFPDVLNRQVPPPEPELNVHAIQGNVLAGFNKDFQTLLCLQIDDAEQFGQWLGVQINFIATAAQVLAFNRAFKNARAERKADTNVLKATFLNVAFSHAALTQLGFFEDANGADFADEAFRNGLLQQAQSGVLGDPISDATAEGNPKNWVIGGPDNEADVLLIVASDSRRDMHEEVKRLEETLEAERFRNDENVPPAHVIFKEEGVNLPPPLSGHEHFGFLDGISNPGLRGRVSADEDDVLTPRQNPDKRDQPPKLDAQGNLVSDADKGQPAQGKPGQDLLWPGEFVLGYQKQDPVQQKDAKGNELWDGPNAIPNPVPPLLDNTSTDRKVDLTGIAPELARDGSFLVFRRLRQDVFALHVFLRKQADRLRARKPVGVPEPPNSTLEREIGASLVGRWTSGAPVERSRAVKSGSNPPVFDPQLPDDDRNLANDDCANNFFEYQGAEDPLPDKNVNDPFACTDDNPNPPPAKFLPAPGDPDGKLLPFTGHVRKAYPRDDVSAAVPGLNESSTQTHRILRRGIPFGPVSPSTPESPFDDGVNRGLHFLAYQASIVNQFEFITRNWVNNPNFKERFRKQPAGPLSDPKQQGGGHDPIIGQNAAAGENRVRTFTIAYTDDQGRRQVEQVSTADVERKEWVIPTGGGYFFAPSIKALCQMAGVETETGRCKKER